MKRPFVLKTGEMDGKIENIKKLDEDLVLDGQKASDIIEKVKEWLELVAKHAKIYKNAQTALSSILKILSKKTLSSEDKAILTQNLDTLGVTRKPSDNVEDTIQIPCVIHNISSPEIPRTFDYLKCGNILELLEDNTKPNYADFVEDAKKLEEDCRKTKQELKDKFEKVYKELKKFINIISLRNEIYSDKYFKNKTPSKSKIHLFSKLKNLLNNACMMWKNAYGIPIDQVFLKGDEWTELDNEPQKQN